MTYTPGNHHRRSIRLNGYDYSQAGAYFVTICAKDRECLFGDIVGGEMMLNDAGVMVRGTWNNLTVKYPGIEIDEFVVMPNHIHGIIMIVGAQFIAPSGTITFNCNGAIKQGAINRAPTIGECVHSRRVVLTTSTKFVILPPCPSGNATITNTSYAMIKI